MKEERKLDSKTTELLYDIRRYLLELQKRECEVTEDSMKCPWCDAAVLEGRIRALLVRGINEDSFTDNDSNSGGD